MKKTNPQDAVASVKKSTIESKSHFKSDVLRAIGLFTIISQASNPNGDPDKKGMPRLDNQAYLYLSGVCIKRRIRDLIATRSAIFMEICKALGIDKDEIDARFNIYVQSHYGPTDLQDELKALGTEGFLEKFWDARVFGTTILMKGNEQFKTSGPIHVPNSSSIHPVELINFSQTRCSGAKEDQEQTIAGENRRVALGVIAGSYEVLPDAARVTRATQQDIEVFVRLLAYAYSDRRSTANAGTEVVQHYHFEVPADRSLRAFPIREGMKPQTIDLTRKEKPTSLNQIRFKKPSDVAVADHVNVRTILDDTDVVIRN